MAWEVLKKSQIVGADSNTEFAEFIQALTGTMIIKAPTNDSAGPEVIYKPNILVKEETIKAMLDGGQVQILECDEKDKCLNPTQKTITLTADKAFRKRIVDILNDISARIASKQAIETKGKDLINNTSIPVYKAILVRQTYTKSATANISNVNLYSSLVAVDLLYNYIDQILRQVEEQAKQVQNFDQSHIEKFEVAVGKARVEIGKYKIDQKDSFDNTMKLMQDTMKIEGYLAGSLSAKMKTNLLWSSKFQ